MVCVAMNFPTQLCLFSYWPIRILHPLYLSSRYQSQRLHLNRHVQFTLTFWQWSVCTHSLKCANMCKQSWHETKTSLPWISGSFHSYKIPISLVQKEFSTQWSQWIQWTLEVQFRVELPSLWSLWVWSHLTIQAAGYGQPGIMPAAGSGPRGMRYRMR